MTATRIANFCIETHRTTGYVQVIESLNRGRLNMDNIILLTFQGKLKKLHGEAYINA